MQSCLVGQPISQTEIGACGQGSEIFSLSDHWVERVPIVMLGMFHHHRQHQWDQCPQDGDRVGELGAIDLTVPGGASMDQLVA